MNPSASHQRHSFDRERLKAGGDGELGQIPGKSILERFGYHRSIERGEVEFSIPLDSTVEDLLTEVQRSYLVSSGRSAISSEVLEACIDLARKEKQDSWVGAHRVHVTVENSTNKSTEEQRVFLASRGLKPAHLIKTVAGHALHLLATGQDLLQGEYVRTEQGAVVLEEGGLSFDPEDDGYLNGNVGISGEPII